MEANRHHSLARGGIYPRGCPHGPSEMRSEYLVEGLDPTIEVMARVQQPVERQVLDADGRPVASLRVAGKSYASRTEMAAREVRIPSLPNRTATVKPGGSKRAELIENGAPAGGLLWRWGPLHCTVEAWIDEIEAGLRRVRVHIANRLEWNGGVEQALSQTLYSPEIVMHSPDGSFLSTADPTASFRRPLVCHSEGLWPVPVGEAGDRRTVLASVIRFADYPALRPGSLAEPFVSDAAHSRAPLGAVRHAA